MKVIPAIDIMGGMVVRLLRGDAKKSKVYSSSPIEVARRWVSCGAGLIHVVDLDGAIEGTLKNFELVREIAGKISAKVEFGGGIRDIETARSVLESGIDKIVIGTKATDGGFISSLDGYMKARVVIGIDARDGIAYTGGWQEGTGLRAVDLARQMEESGFKTINYTDISRDGTLKGPNIKGIKEVLKAVRIDVIASGGVSGMEDLKRLKDLEAYGLKGVIIGKAIYEDMVDLKEAIMVCGGR